MMLFTPALLVAIALGGRPLAAVSPPPAPAAERGVLVVEVRDVRRRPVHGVRVAVAGDGTGDVTDQDGRARIRLAPATRPGTVVSLRVRPGRDSLVLLSPWDEQTRVPPWENEQQNYVTVYVTHVGDRDALASGTFLVGVMTRMEGLFTRAATAGARRGGEAAASALRDSVRAVVAQQFGVPPATLDSAIRLLGQRTTDPYEKGLAAMHEQNYPAAEASLTESLDRREAELAAMESRVYDNAFMLGEARYRQGRYQDAAVAYERAWRLRPDEPAIMDRLAFVRLATGDFVGADSLHARLLARAERTPGPRDLMLVFRLQALATVRKARDAASADTLAARALRIAEADSSMAGVLHAVVHANAETKRARGDLAAAEALARRAVALARARGVPKRPTSPGDSIIAWLARRDVATYLTTLARVRADAGDLVGAESSLREALALERRDQGENGRHVASALAELAGLAQRRRDLVAADSLYARALVEDERHGAPEFPDLVGRLSSLVSVRVQRDDYAGADSLLAREVRIVTHVLGPDHRITVGTRFSLAGVRRVRDPAGADTLARGVLAAQTRTLGPDHPQLLNTLHLFAMIRRELRDLAGADSLLRRAIALGERAYGPDDARLVGPLNSFGKVLAERGDLAAAEPVLRRAISLGERAASSDEDLTARAMYNLASVLARRGDRAGAAPLVTRALAIQERVLGPDHRETRESRELVARLR
jgi:tetratricopeptide (TPR) repeat protein